MKTMMRILAVVLCMLMAVPAFADATLVAENISASSFVYRTNYIEMSGNDGYYLATIDGTAITDALYDGFEYQYGGYVSAAHRGVNSINQDGLFDAAGNIMIPFEYGDIEVMRGGEWAIAYVLADSTADQYDYKTYDDEYFIIDYVDIYHLPDLAKITLERENFHEVDDVNHCLNIKDRATGIITTYDASFNALGTVDSMYDTDYAPADYVKFRENGQYGYTDAAGNVIMAPSYSYIDTNDSYRSDYVTICADDDYGLVRRSTGELIVPAEYDRVIPNYYAAVDVNSDHEYGSCGYYCVVEDGKVGYVAEGGEITSAPKYSYDLAEIHGASFTIVDLEGNTILIAADGVETVLPKYENMYCLDYTSGIYYKVTDENYNYGIIDWHGNEVLPCKYSNISVSGNGLYVLATEDYSVTYLYQLSYPNGGAQAPAAEQPAAIGESGSNIGSSLSGLLGGGSSKDDTEEETATEEMPAVEEAPVEAPAEVPAAEGSADNGNAVGLLTSASTLLKTDPAANSSAAVSLLGTAIGMLANNGDATSVLTTALNLLVGDPEGNAATVISLIDSAIILLK